MVWTMGTLLAVILLLAVVTPTAGDWRTASREPAGLAPDPELVREAVVQVYAARAWGWRGRFAVHSWIAVKPMGAPAFTVYEVIGWRKYRQLPVVAIHRRAADARWFGAKPALLLDVRGDGVDDIIRGIDAATASYPYPGTYRAWPGPNSNTFTAHVLRSVPELAVDLPPTAIGKDYLAGGVFAEAPSNTGYQVSLFGLAGLLVAREEGVEINILGLVFGLDPWDVSLKLPLIGRVGFAG